VLATSRAALRARLLDAQYAKLPGSRRFLDDVRARTRDGETVAVVAPPVPGAGFYLYARSLYPLAGRNVVTSPAGADAIAAYRVMPVVPGFVVVWRSDDGVLLRTTVPRVPRGSSVPRPAPEEPRNPRNPRNAGGRGK